MLRVKKVARGSLAADLGVQKGDRILSFDGHPAVDELDYLFYNAGTKFTMEVEDDFSRASISVEKDEE